MKVTVLIAVFNAEAYLRTCLDSMISQTHEDWEAICVDDASTDSSLHILNEYAEKDKRFKVLHLATNQGQATARNKAIELAQGELVCFLDSDDWFADDSIEKSVKVFETNPQADCVLFRLIKAYPHGSSFRYEEYKNDTPTSRDSSGHEVLSGHDAFVQSLDWSLHGVYMTRMAIQKKYPYDDFCRSYSDDNTTRLHYLASREVRLCDGEYYYRQNPASVSNVEDISRFNFLLANEHMQQMLQELQMPDSILNLHEVVRHNNLIGCYLFFCRHRKAWSKSDRDYALTTMKRIWHTIEANRLDGKTRKRFGYLHCPSWTLFRIQEEVFYKLRCLRSKVF